MLYTDKLETERLVTRFVTPADKEIWLEYCSDPVATLYTAIANKTPEEMTATYIDFTIQRYEEGRFGLQALISKENGEFIGQCGLLKQVVNGKEEIEVGYHLLRRHWGKGYAIEAAGCFRDLAFRSGLSDTVISIIHPDNLPSQKVAERNGMRHRENSDFKSTIDPSMNREYFIYRIDKAEWDAIQIYGK